MALKHLPSILYKYKELDEKGHTLKLLRNGEMYFPSIADFNDPFEGSIPFVYKKSELTVKKAFNKLRECNIHSDLSDEELRKFIRSKEGRIRYLKDNASEEHIIEVRNNIERSFGIFCLTSRDNNFLMWSHYADSHRGICIGFDTIFFLDLHIGRIWKVNYQKKLPRFKMNEDTDKFVSKMLCTKSDVWKYEDEYRFIKEGPPHTIEKIPSEAIVSVVLGNSMTYDKNIFADELLKINPTLKILNSTISNSSFKIELNSIR
jgi:hypothetical protein